MCVVGNKFNWIGTHLVHLPLMLFAPKIQKYSEKIVLNFQGIVSTFIFDHFFIAQKIQKTD